MIICRGGTQRVTKYIEYYWLQLTICMVIIQVIFALDLEWGSQHFHCNTHFILLSIHLAINIFSYGGTCRCPIPEPTCCCQSCPSNSNIFYLSAWTETGYQVFFRTDKRPKMSKSILIIENIFFTKKDIMNGKYCCFHSFLFTF